MTHASYWTASDGTWLHYRDDDFTDPWQEAPLVALLRRSALTPLMRWLRESALRGMRPVLED